MSTLQQKGETRGYEHTYEVTNPFCRNASIYFHTIYGTSAVYLYTKEDISEMITAPWILFIITLVATLVQSYRVYLLNNYILELEGDLHEAYGIQYHQIK